MVFMVQKVYFLFFLVLILLSFSFSAQGASESLAPRDFYIQVRQLQPEISDDDFLAKAQTITNSYKYIRTLIPAFYWRWAQAAMPLTPAVSELTSESGWCVGDAHPENFGALLNDQGKAFFLVNDLDDAGVCPLVEDFYKFLLSAKYLNSSMSLASLWQSYLNGLQGMDLNPPTWVNQLLTEAQGQGLLLDSFSSGKQNCTRQEFRDLEILLSQKFNDRFSISDCWQVTKVGGGSGGLQRYRLEIRGVRTPPASLELKRQIRPGVFPVSAKLMPTEERLQQAYHWEWGQTLSLWSGMVSYGNFDFLIRPRYAGNISVVWDDVSSSKDRFELLNYEFWILGQIHRKTASAKYISSLMKIPATEILQNLQVISEQIESDFQKFQQQRP